MDELINSEELNIEKKDILEGYKNPNNKEEILNLLKIEESICKIKLREQKYNKINKVQGSGFFCEIKNKNNPINYCLFTNNHILNKSNMKLDNIQKYFY